MACPGCEKDAKGHCDNPNYSWGWCASCRIVFNRQGRTFHR